MFVCLTLSGGHTRWNGFDMIRYLFIWEDFVSVARNCCGVRSGFQLGIDVKLEVFRLICVVGPYGWFAMDF